MAKHKYAYEEAKVTCRSPEVGVHAYNTAEDFEHASVGVMECGGRIKNPVTDLLYPVLEGEENFYFGGEEGREVELVTVGNDALPIPKGKVYDCEGRMRLFLSHSPAYDVQGCDVYYDDLWK